jgi:hypothetical protein
MAVFMLSVTIKHIMLGVVILSVFMLRVIIKPIMLALFCPNLTYYAECHHAECSIRHIILAIVMLSVTIKHIMLGIVNADCHS